MVPSTDHEIARDALAARVAHYDETIAAALALTHALSVATGDSLVREGSVSEHAYIVRSGRAHVFVDGQPVAELGPGSIVGDPWLRGEPAPATVRAATPMRLLILDSEALAVLDASMPS